MGHPIDQRGEETGWGGGMEYTSLIDLNAMCLNLYVRQCHSHRHGKTFGSIRGPVRGDDVQTDLYHVRFRVCCQWL